KAFVDFKTLRSNSLSKKKWEKTLRNKIQMHLLILLLLLVAAFNDGVYSFSCDIGGRPACVLSCQVQNCATGYCEDREGRNICVCSRCASGGTPPFGGITLVMGRSTTEKPVTGWTTAKK
ncbi:hypothetical protein OESDEN_13641, partial [Oesophagostomum dentatum]